MTSIKPKPGLTTFQLKLLALLFMTIDHLGAYASGIPLFAQHYTLLRILGRISAPLFLFAIVQGAIHTKSKVKYFLRLYLAGVGIGIFDTVFYILWGKALAMPKFGNIFFTFAFVVLYIFLAERLLTGYKKRSLKLILTAALGFAASLLPMVAMKIFHAVFADSEIIRGILSQFLPQLIYVQYGFPFVVLGVCMYFAKAKQTQCLVYLVFCIVCTGLVFSGCTKLGIFPYLLGSNYNTLQCWMVLALPFMLLYNGKKGAGGKWLFYGYYPIHRYVLVFLNLLMK